MGDSARSSRASPVKSSAKSSPVIPQLTSRLAQTSLVIPQGAEFGAGSPMGPQGTLRSTWRNAKSRFFWQLAGS